MVPLMRGRPTQVSERAPGSAESAWHSMGAAEVLQRLNVDAQRGLGSGEVEQLQRTHGLNALEAHAGRSAWSVLWSQFKNVMVAVLIVAGTTSALVGEALDAG